MIPDFPFEYEIEKSSGVPNTVKEDRKRLIEASVVRTLKSKRERGPQNKKKRQKTNHPLRKKDEAE